MTAEPTTIDLLAGTWAPVESEGSPWSHFRVGTHVADDGHLLRDGGSVRVRSSGSHPRTGEPAFVRSVAQESGDHAEALHGGLDHVKWLVYSTATAATGIPGFDAPDAGDLTFTAAIGVTCYGTSAHGFGDAVADCEDDLRLACAAMNVIDFETFMVFDFMLTNRGVYALYERLPYAREQLGRYGAFTFAKKVANRRPDATSELSIVYNRADGLVRWLVAGEEVMRVDRIGHLIDRRHMLLDHGGEATDVRPRQLACGFGLFTVLDAAGPDGAALARLSSAEDFYFDPRRGEPHPARFRDDQSREASRLFGHGAELTLARYTVSAG